MKVKQLIKELKTFNPELDVGIKWLNAIDSLEVVGVVRLGKNFKKTKRAGKYEYVLLSPFDIDVDRDDDY